MDKPGDIAAGVLDGVCSALRIVDVAFLWALFSAYLSLSLCLFNSLGPAIWPTWTKSLRRLELVIYLSYLPELVMLNRFSNGVSKSSRWVVIIDIFLVTKWAPFWFVGIWIMKWSLIGRHHISILCLYHQCQYSNIFSHTNGVPNSLGWEDAICNVSIRILVFPIMVVVHEIFTWAINRMVAGEK